MESKNAGFIIVLTFLIFSTILIVSVEAAAEDARVIVIPVDFPDKPGGYSPSIYVSKLNGSIYDYWWEVSYGKLNVRLYTLSSWLRLDKDYAFYGEDTNDVERNTCRLVLDSIKAADPHIDFRRYNYIIIMHSGRDQAYTHEDMDIHSKSAFCGRISTEEKTFIQYVSIVSYEDPLGVWAHEFGHLLGLPDLYDTSSKDKEDSFVGPWDLMADGSWNGPLGCPGCSPAELTSWSRTKLGWIKENDILVVEKGFRRNVLLKPLHQYEGVRVVKIVLDNPETYYLLEAREKIGYDKYLPSSGVLILYVDESKGSGEGIVKIVPPPDGSIYYATYNVGSQFQDKTLQLSVTVDRRDTEGYFLTIVYGLLKHTLTIKTFPYGKIWINGTAYTGDSGGILRIELEEGTYIVSIQEESTQDNLRYVFDNWSDGVSDPSRIIVLDRDQEYVLNYSRFYYVNVSTDYGKAVGGGWYREGEQAFIELAEDNVIEFENDTRLVFYGWRGDVNSNQSKIFFTVDSPKNIQAQWIRQYRVMVSTFPNTSEEKWVNSGEFITVKAMREINLGNKTKLVFHGWNGVDDYNETVTLQVNKPLYIEALWEKNYLVEVVFLETVDERLYWVEAGEYMNLSSQLYRYISDSLRLRFNGWRGSIQSEEQTVSFIVSSPMKMFVKWIREYKVQPFFTTIDGKPLTVQPSKLVLYKDGRRITWNSEPVWIMEGQMIIEEILWNGVDVSTKMEFTVDSDTVVIPTTLKEIKIKAFDLLGNPLQDLDVSVIVDGVEIFRANGSGPTVYVPQNTKSLIIILYGLSTVRVPNPSNNLEITIPVISLTSKIHIALAQIFLLAVIVILLSAFYYIKKPVKIRAKTTIVSRAIRRMSLTEL
mgnify:CR=1 FL=1